MVNAYAIPSMFLYLDQTEDTTSAAATKSDFHKFSNHKKYANHEKHLQAEIT